MILWRRRIHFWAGALSALASSWLAFALIFWVAATLFNAFDWGWLIAAPLVLFSFFGTFFAAGVLCAFFWSPIADEQTCLNWGAWVVLMVLSPLLLIHLLALLLLILLYPLTVVPFHVGAEFGAHWWKQRRWRHFLGLANDYERDTSREQR